MRLDKERAGENVEKKRERERERETKKWEERESQDRSQNHFVT